VMIYQHDRTILSSNYYERPLSLIQAGGLSIVMIVVTG